MKGIMIQATSSDAGKSFIVTGLCRIFADMGIKVCPFKSQNMSNNAFVTQGGLEMSMAQAVQAEAAHLIPDVFMNPILLKPKHDSSSEIILNGNVISTPAEKNYYRSFSQGQGIMTVRDALKHIKDNFDAVLIEGAGSPAEVNLNAHEIVNMRIAREADVPVLLVTDVDRGGSLASIVGTLELLGEDRDRVKGLIFNRFRGDIALFESAVSWAENYTGIHVVGVVPYMSNVHLPGEDSLNAVWHSKKNESISDGRVISIGIIKLPSIANFTDFSPLDHEQDVALSYVDDRTPLKKLRKLDAIIIPGSKNTLHDMAWLIQSGLDEIIRDFCNNGGHVLGVCGGFQMLGTEILDPLLKENRDFTHIHGLGILPLRTTFGSPAKRVSQVSGVLMPQFLSDDQATVKISGYEIHFGNSLCDYDKNFIPIFEIGSKPEGMASHDLKITGTYIHGLFDNDAFRTVWLNSIRRKKNYVQKDIINIHALKEDTYNSIAGLLRNCLDMNFITRLLLHHEGTTLPHV